MSIYTIRLTNQNIKEFFLAKNVCSKKTFLYHEEYFGWIRKASTMDKMNIWLYNL